jgi:hypothetical protein
MFSVRATTVNAVRVTKRENDCLRYDLMEHHVNVLDRFKSQTESSLLNKLHDFHNINSAKYNVVKY